MFFICFGRHPCRGVPLFCAQMLKFKIFLEKTCVTKKLAYLYTMTNAQNNNTMNAQQLHGRFVNVTGKGFGEVIDFVIDGGDYNNNVVELVTILYRRSVAIIGSRSKILQGYYLQRVQRFLRACRILI